EECGQCEALLQAFDESADGLVTGLRHLPARAGKEIGELPPDLMMIARRAPVAPANGVPAEISIDSGRRYARQLAQGECRLGKFRLQAELGAGTFGYVFRAQDTELDRTVALKIQRVGSLANDEEKSRFLREARSVAQLKHAGIVSLYEIGQTDEGVCFLV